MLETDQSTATIVSLLSWWHEAGVDLLVDEQPGSWLDRRTPTGTAVPVPIADPQAVSAALPDTLAALVAWLQTSPDVPDAGSPDRRIVANGVADADLMIITDMPEVGDHDVGHLFSGPLGRLFDAMLAAIGRDRHSVYIVPLCPGRTATGQISKTAMVRLSEIARHHIALVVPKRLWLLGSTASRAILGMDDVASAGNLHDFNHATVKVPTVASFAPRFLLENPAQKAKVWADMQALIKGM
jgi:uracil-DNA glycosylase